MQHIVYFWPWGQLILVANIEITEKIVNGYHGRQELFSA